MSYLMINVCRMCVRIDLCVIQSVPADSAIRSAPSNFVQFRLLESIEMMKKITDVPSLLCCQLVNVERGTFPFEHAQKWTPSYGH